MGQRRSRFLLLSSSMVLSVAGAVFADGYRNPPPTAEGIAKSGVHSAFVDDASAVFYNPANLAFQTNKSLVVSATFARTENKYSPAAGISFDSDGDWNVLPDVYYSQPIGDGVVFGLGITSPYGQGLSWNKSDFYNPSSATAVPYDASIMLLNINPTIAFQLSDSVSVGAGADIVYSELELNAWFPTPDPANPLVDASGEGEGWGVGGNLGITWQMTEKQRLTATYKSRVDVDYDGDFSLGGDFGTFVKFPNTYGLGYGVELTDDVRIEALVEWLEWSVNDTQPLEVAGQSMPQQNNWDDTLTVGIAADWQLTDRLALRAGYAFIETPVPDSTITPLLPDADRHALSVGAGYSIGGHTLDLAYTYSIYEDRESSNPLLPGTYNIDSDLVGMTYSYSF